MQGSEQISFNHYTGDIFQALCVQNEQLEEAQIKAINRVSNHKQATQLLQTELQDSRAEVEERENTIRSLKSKLRESEVCLNISLVFLYRARPEASTNNSSIYYVFSVNG